MIIFDIFTHVMTLQKIVISLSIPWPSTPINNIKDIHNYIIDRELFKYSPCTFSPF